MSDIQTKAKILYQAIIAERTMTDPLTLAFEGFLVNHFAHEGTVIIRESREQNPAKPQEPIAGRSTLQPFVHPLSKGTAPKFQAVATQEPELAIVGKPPAKNDTPSNSPSPQVAAGDQSKEFDPILAKDMKPKALANHYSRGLLIEFLNSKRINFDVSKSNVQLAAMIIAHLNRAKTN